MDYRAANLILGSALTPGNRCIAKKTATDNYADPAPLQNFTYNRLVPVTTGYVKLLQYTIRFLNWDNSVLQSSNVTRGQTPSYTGSTPTKTGHNFTGWSPAVTAATKAQDYVAQFSPASYTVTYTWTVPGGSAQSTTETVVYGNTPANVPSPSVPTNYTGAWSPSNPSTTVITGPTTFTFNYTYTPPPVTMLADVGWKTADAGQGTPHGDPNNVYELDSQWIPSNKIPIHVWFEPMYTSNGTELSYTDPIATVNGTNVSHNDLTWSISIGTSTQGYNYWHTGSYNRYDCLVIEPIENNPSDGPLNRNFAATVGSNSDELYWMDEFPFTITGTYGGVTVVQKTMTIVCYKYSIDYAGYNSSTYKGSKEGWVKNWNL